MNRLVPRVVLILQMLAVLTASPALADTPRPPWTTSHVTGSPEPPSPYVVERVFPDLTFREPTDFALEPGTGRWFILQVDGTVIAIDPRDGSQTKILEPKAAGIQVHQAYGIVFHPRYESNREVFLAYATVPQGENGRRVSRFVLPKSTGRIDPSSEEVLMSWFTMDHNGGNLQFGPDGMLYITAGDSAHAYPPDEFNAGQNLQDVRGAILRIDVDHREAGRPYAIPPDNPFVEVPGARGEIWAFGLRNPWKITFDPHDGQLWCGDVGWEMWELVYQIQKGGNYGWPLREGRQPVRTDVTQGPGEILRPLVDHPHSEARSITGGFVYQGTQLPELRDAYIYGDWSTGIIWALKVADGKIVSHERLVDSPLAIISFGLDAENELVILDYAGGLYRLVRNTSAGSAQPFPTRLSETGIFASTPDLVPAPGVIPYQLNAGLYSDGAQAHRWIAIPESGSIPLPFIKYPRDTVFVKSLSWPRQDLPPLQLETQLLHFDGSEWRGYSYLWNDDQTDAELAPPEGKEKEFLLEGGATGPGERLSWKVESRASCMICHGWIIGHVVGFNFPNLDRRYDSATLKQALSAAAQPADAIAAAEKENQIELLKEWKVFNGNQFPQQHRGTMVNPYDRSADLTARARSYLAINCAHCHRREGGGTARIEFPFEHTLEKTNAIDAPAMLGTFGIPGAKVIASGEPYHSVLYYRMSTVGRGHMPHLGSRNVDEQGLELLREWIASLKPAAGGAASAGTEPDPIRPEDLARLSGQQTEQLLANTSEALRLADRLAQLHDRTEQQQWAGRLATVSPPQVRGVFERFLPPSERVETLGTSIDTAQILAMAGQAESGRQLFLRAEGVACRQCHRCENEGKEVGPDLSKIGGQRSREQILESILDPSRQIDPKYVTHAVETTDGRIVTGVIREKTADRLVLRDASGKEVSLQTDEIEAMAAQPRSLMPDLLCKEMTAQDLADLLAYLTSLK